MIKLNRYTIVALSAAFFIMCGISCTEEIEQEQTYSTKEVTLSLSTRSIMGDANRGRTYKDSLCTYLSD